MVARVVFVLSVLGIVQGALIDSCNITKRFVDGHNMRRLLLAKGAVAGQPAASRMTYITWDEDLAKKSAKWASKKKYGHNPDKTTLSGKFNYVGENIYIYKTTAANYQFDPEMAMKSWWDEYKDFSYGKISQSHFSSGHKKIGHYTQMAWADSVKLGCAISQYRQNRWNCFFVVCNYGPGGNYIGQFPYKSGKGASGRLVCDDPESNCTQKYGSKCGKH